tara:strand:- start:23101 stop:23256 length:156 start_codon:yes stop_codon:yes gene_type:complete
MKHLVDFVLIFSLHLRHQKLISKMENYIITLGTYLILMLFFKIYVAVAAKE